MKRIIAERTGGPEVLVLSEESKPEPGPGEVRVKVLAAGVAFGDLLWMSGVVPGIPIDNKREDFVEVVSREGGVDMVVDHIGGSHLARSFKCLRPGGILVSTSSYAAALGQSGMLESVGGLIRIQIWNLWPNRRSALLFDVTPYYKKNPGLYAQDLPVLTDHLAAGRLNPVLDKTYPLEEGKQALEYLREGKAKGKVVLLTEAYKAKG